MVFGDGVGGSGIAVEACREPDIFTDDFTRCLDVGSSLVLRVTNTPGLGMKLVGAFGRSGRKES